MKESNQTSSQLLEPRWPVALAIIVVITLLAMLPKRIQLAPVWVAYVLGVGVLLPVAMVGLMKDKALWRRIEHYVIRAFFVIVALGTVLNLGSVIRAMGAQSAGISGLQLFASSVAVWLTSVITFSLLYWQIDRGGPGGRRRQPGFRPDWLFPQEGAPSEHVPADWRPTFVDYLYLSYSTAIAFSTCEAAPLTTRAKLLMMLESMISFVNIVVVASRAINILG